MNIITVLFWLSMAGLAVSITALWAVSNRERFGRWIDRIARKD